MARTAGVLRDWEWSTEYSGVRWCYRTIRAIAKEFPSVDPDVVRRRYAKRLQKGTAWLTVREVRKIFRECNHA